MREKRDAAHGTAAMFAKQGGVCVVVVCSGNLVYTICEGWTRKLMNE